MLARIIERERPDALLPTMGGQTALNLAIALADAGVLEECGVEMIGAKAEDRGLELVIAIDPALPDRLEGENFSPDLVKALDGLTLDGHEYIPDTGTAAPIVILQNQDGLTLSVVSFRQSKAVIAAMKASSRPRSAGTSSVMSWAGPLKLS